LNQAGDCCEKSKKKKKKSRKWDFAETAHVFYNERGVSKEEGSIVVNFKIERQNGRDRKGSPRNEPLLEEKLRKRRRKRPPMHGAIHETSKEKSRPTKRGLY